ncbi:hypothetical protein ACVWY2_001319 [Bradyrhizobium sp. JR6.1]
MPLTELAGEIADRLARSNEKPLIESEQWAACAAAVTYLKDHLGVGLAEALRSVAKAAGGKISERQLREFRKNVGKGRARPEAIQFHNFEIQRNKTALRGLEPNIQKDVLLKSIRRVMGDGSPPTKGKTRNRNTPTE